MSRCPDDEDAPGLHPVTDAAANEAAADKAAANKALVRRLVDEVINSGRLEALEELFVPERVGDARRWITPFRRSFPDVHMRSIALVAEDDEVAGRFTCSATHLGPWLGHPPTGRRFMDVAEGYFFRFRDGRIAETWGLEDNASRLLQLGLDTEG
jgi:predicted ester cyclase